MRSNPILVLPSIQGNSGETLIPADGLKTRVIKDVAARGTCREKTLGGREGEKEGDKESNKQK